MLHWQRVACCALTVLSAVGCGERTASQATSVRSFAVHRASIADPALTPAGLISAPIESAASEPKLIPLPDLDDDAAASARTSSGAADAPAPPADQVSAGPLLLPPEELSGEYAEAIGASVEHVHAPPANVAETPTVPAAVPAPAIADIAPHPAIVPSVAKELPDVSPVASGEPTGAMVSQRAQDKIRRGYALAQRGAYFAARRELVDVLQSIAEAKDQLRGAPRRTPALAKGLRALEEAADFCPRGAEGDTGLSMAVIVSSHRTPVGKSADAAQLMPTQLADLYLQYAQVQLGGAVVGEPAGSMALHALGKIYSQLGAQDPDKEPLADRQAFALQHAALLARPDNNLAAHELGVMLAESGHYQEAEYMLNQVATRQPHATVLKNLARVQRKLGRDALAAISDQQAQLLAAADSNGAVRWVPPQTLAQATDAVPPSQPRLAARPSANAPCPSPMGAPPSQQFTR
jgi:tetratricopeptide (TPR) repeat protein